MSEREEFKAIQLELFALQRTQKQLTLRLTQLRLLVRRLGVALRKMCIRCEIEMDAEQFYRCARYSDGLYPYCRDCKRTMNRDGHRRVA